MLRNLVSLSLKSILFIPVPNLDQSMAFVDAHTYKTKSFWAGACSENAIDIWALRANMNDGEPVLDALIREYKKLVADGDMPAAEDLRSFIFAHHHRYRRLGWDHHPDLLQQINDAFPQYREYMNRAVYLTRAGRYTIR